MDFGERLRQAARARSWVCIGLDPDAGRNPRLAKAEAVVAFNRQVIEATSDLVGAYKMNSAYYEALGARGFEALRKTRALIPDGVIAILDAKRGDVPHTAKQYAKAAFETFGYDALTASPYLGLDAILPFLEDKTRGCFVLVRTTNPGASEVQSLEAAGHPLYETIAHHVAEWAKAHENLGAVAGATEPAELRRVREIVGENVPLLIPGIGAQGGDAASAFAAGANAKGEMALVTASRSVIYAGDKPAVREACEALVAAVRAAKR